jgi:hypothetical protein
MAFVIKNYRLAADIAIEQAKLATEGNRKQAIFSMARTLALSNWDAERILETCIEVGNEVGLPEDRIRDLPRDVRDAMRYAERGTNGLQQVSFIQSVKADPEIIDARVRDNFEPTPYQERLHEISPIYPDEIDSRAALSLLFPDDPLLWIAPRENYGRVSRWSTHKTLSRLASNSSGRIPYETPAQRTAALLLAILITSSNGASLSQSVTGT